MRPMEALVTGAAVIVDAGNLLDPAAARAAGFIYIEMGGHGG